MSKAILYDAVPREDAEMRDLNMPLDQLRRSFEQAFGTNPYPYQERTAAALLTGHNVLLRAPTGSGKTNAALLPFLFAKEQNTAFADRLIFAFPLRTLAQAQYDDVRKVCARVAPSLKVTMQTGSHREDEFFQGDVIFTTIDQLLSAYIGVPVSLATKLANIPAAAVLGSYVVFDEVHLLEPGRALATALDLAQRLANHARVLMMTATLSTEASEIVLERLGTGALEVGVPVDEALAIPSQAGKKRRYIWHPEPLNSSAILATYQPGGNSIVVVNSVQRAQDLAVELRRELGTNGPEVILLHARYLTGDRTSIEAKLVQRLSERGSGNLIAIATQVIEVGLNISSTVMHTEVAPANAVIQRAGRCARFATPKSGTVHIYMLERNDDGKLKYGPYSEDKTLVDATIAAFEHRQDRVLQADDELALVNEVHAASDQTVLAQCNPSTRAEQVMASQRNGKPDNVRALVRSIDSVSLYVNDNPSALAYGPPLEGFSLQRIVAQGIIAALKRTGNLNALYTVELADDDDTGRGALTWRPVSSAGEAQRAFALCLLSTHADYSGDIGLTVAPEGNASGNFRCPPLASRGRAWANFSYVKETYAEHVNQVVAEHDSLAGESLVARARLETALGLVPGAVERLSQLVARLHDVGKLSRGWQDAVWNWQLDHGDKRHGFLAHTDFNGNDPVQREAEQRGKRTGRYKRPPHAAEGAYAALRTLAADGLNLGCAGPNKDHVLKALFSAIARHHSSSTENLADFELAAGADRAVRETLGSPPAKLDDQPNASERARFSSFLSTPQLANDGFLLYLYLARRLRLADRAGTAKGSHRP